MSFFNEIGKKISETSNTVLNKGINIVDTAKINLQISEKEKYLNECYQQLGKAYYDKYKDDLSKEFSNFVANIKDTREKIESLKEEAKKTESILCPNCNSAIPYGNSFCINCGQKIEDMIDICPHCKAKIKKGSIFCTSCGKKI